MVWVLLYQHMMCETKRRRQAYDHHRDNHPITPPPSAAHDREAWTKGLLCARSRETAIDEAFSSAFGSLQARTSEQDEAAAAAERDRAEERARACSTVWDTAKYGVPVRTLRELMDEKVESAR